MVGSFMPLMWRISCVLGGCQMLLKGGNPSRESCNCVIVSSMYGVVDEGLMGQRTPLNPVLNAVHCVLSGI